MKICSNAHTHTTFCDGKSTPEEQVLSAISKGFVSLGITGHAFTAFDLSYCMKLEEYPAYLGELERLKKLYGDRLDLVIGMEQDLYRVISPVDFQLPPSASKEELPIRYRIASVHYIRDEQNDRYYEVDLSADELESCKNEMFGGNGLKMAERFYQESVRNAFEGQGDILGHFDLIRKLNDGGRFFDEDSPEYQRIALSALEEAAKAGIPFEVNTAGYRNGKKNQPYLTIWMLRKLAELKAPVIITSDCHVADQLDFQFDRAVELLRELGFKSVLRLQGKGPLFEECPLDERLEPDKK